jgi:hypothetical protein
MEHFVFDDQSFGVLKEVQIGQSLYSVSQPDHGKPDWAAINSDSFVFRSIDPIERSAIVRNFYVNFQSNY